MTVPITVAAPGAVGEDPDSLQVAEKKSPARSIPITETVRIVRRLDMGSSVKKWWSEDSGSPSLAREQEDIGGPSTRPKNMHYFCQAGQCCPATLRRGRRPRPGREGKPCPTGVEQLAWNLSGTTLISLAAREVSRRGGGARRG